MGLTRAQKKYFLDRMNSTARKIGLGDLLIDKFAITVSGTDPASPFTGQLYFNSVSSELKLYNGTAWVVVAMA